jgi:hypothetical protein
MGAAYRGVAARFMAEHVLGKEAMVDRDRFEPVWKSANNLVEVWYIHGLIPLA